MARQSLALESGADVRPEDSGRLAGLVRDHLTFVWRCLRRLGLSVAEADDAAQEVVLLAARRLHEIAVGSERSFLFSAALRIAASSRRKLERRREVLCDELDGLLVADGADPEQLLDQRRARELLDGILGELSLEHRIVIVLFEVEQLSVPEIANLLRLKTGTVASRLRRARADFERHVARLEASARFRGELP
jgi:RNA polymerase sigma-70 factor (ECF subfamily)